MIRVFINGFGRIGRAAARIILEDENVELVGINDLYSFEQMAYLLKYDSVYPRLKNCISLNEEILTVDGKAVRLFQEPDPEKLDLSILNVDVVLQCSGMFLSVASNEPYLENGAKRVLVSAPASDAMPTFIYGVNHHDYRGEKIVSNSSCSTNAIVPIFSILQKHFGIASAMMSMYHSYSVYQNILDAKHHSKDIRRTRSSTQNILPLMSSAAEATAYFFPHLKGKMYAKSIRVPVPAATLYSLDVNVQKAVDSETVNTVLKEEIIKNYMGILDFTEETGISDDYVQNPCGAIINLPFTVVSEEKMLRISAWQDNEYGYANQLVKLMKFVSNI